MRLASARPVVLVPALTLVFFASASRLVAQNGDKEWQKDYSLSGSAALTIETGDSHLDIHSCGDCKAIRIHVLAGESLTKFRLEEHQDQNHVYFSLKEKPHVGFEVHWNASHGTQVIVETPSNLELDARTSDGNLSVRNLTGNVRVHTADGSVTLEDLHGDIHLNASDGNISVHNVTGTLDARASDGHMTVDGQFSSVQLHTSDGNLDFALAAGSQLTAASRIESSDGHVVIKLPQNLAADIDISTSDGHIVCALPLAMDHYNSSKSESHHLQGHLNAGGPSLSIRTADGNVSIATL
jgi:Putative adhesin